MKTWLLYFTLTALLFRLNAQVVTSETNQIHLDFSKDINTSLPLVSWEFPHEEFTNSTENQLNIRAIITSDTPLNSVKLGVGQSLENIRDFKNIDLSENKLSANIENQIFLMDGQNYLVLIAENTDGGLVKETRVVTVGMNAITQLIAIDRKDYALIFATDNYDNWNDLVNPVYDAETIAKELEDRYGFVTDLVKNPDQNMVFNKIIEYASRKYKPQDQLFIFFAGHGIYDDVLAEGFVVARNSLKNDPGKNSYISYNRIRNNIDNIPCDHIFLTMDVCYGGTFDPLLASNRNVYDEVNKHEFIAKNLSILTRKFLTSGGKEYVSDGIRGQHSPFARKFIEALRTNGGEDQVLTLAEINLYMQKLQTTPRFGSFGKDEKISEFLFIFK